MRKLFLIILTFSLIFPSCSKKNVFREFHEFDNYTWNRFDKVIFNVPIEKGNLTADINLSVRYLEQFPYDEIPMQIILKTPSGEERIIEKTIKIKDDKGNLIGSAAGNLWDINEVLWKGFYFNQEGNYSIEIENIIPYMGIAGIVDLGLTVRKK